MKAWAKDKIVSALQKCNWADKNYSKKWVTACPAYTPWHQFQNFPHSYVHIYLILTCLRFVYLTLAVSSSQFLCNLSCHISLISNKFGAWIPPTDSNPSPQHWGEAGFWKKVVIWELKRKQTKLPLFLSKVISGYVLSTLLILNPIQSIYTDEKENSIYEIKY